MMCMRCHRKGKEVMAQVRNDEEEVSQIRKGKEVMAQARNDEEEVSQIRNGKAVMAQVRNGEEEPHFRIGHGGAGIE
jgi:hypothetical protein